jgi:hypothetical protein
LLAARLPGTMHVMGSDGVRLTRIAGWVLIAMGALVWLVAPPPGFPLTDDPLSFAAGITLAGLSLPLLTRGRVRIVSVVVMAAVAVPVALAVWARWA